MRFALVLAGTATAFVLTACVLTPLASAQAAPDIVTTHEGGMMRGTIVESVPGDHVTLTLSNGETRTVPWSEVEYAGPEGERPSRVRPAPPASADLQVPTPAPSYGPPSDTLTLRVVTDQEGIDLHEVTGTATASAWNGQAVVAIRAYSFQRLCGTPCTIEVPRGSHHFALSHGGGEVPGQPMDIFNDGTLHVQYVDRTGLRIAGWLTIVLGGLAGAAIATVPILTDSSSAFDNGSFWAGFGVGIGVLAVSEIVGLILAFQGDSAEIRFD